MIGADGLGSLVDGMPDGARNVLTDRAGRGKTAAQNREHGASGRRDVPYRYSHCSFPSQGRSVPDIELDALPESYHTRIRQKLNLVAAPSGRSH